jgi:nucleoside diphosphate kinase
LTPSTRPQPSDVVSGPIPSSAAAPARDRFVLEALEDVARAGVDRDWFLHTHTAFVMKPDAVVRRKLTPGFDLLKAAGFEPVAMTTVRFDRGIVRRSWELERPRDVAAARWRRAVDLFIERCDSLFVLVRDTNQEISATDRMKACKGPARPAERLPHHFRSLLNDAAPLVFNAIHTPNDTWCFARELGLFFDSWARLRLLRSVRERRTCDQREMDDAVARLYAATNPHDLSLSTSLEHLRGVTREAGQLGTIAPHDSARVLDLCAAVESGDHASADRLFELLAGLDLALDLWDLSVICAASAGPEFSPLDEQELR